MSIGNQEASTTAQLLEENEALRRRLEEAEQTIEAIRQGEVDAVVVSGPQGEQVYSLTGAEHVYRVIIETMHEAALTASPDGTILFCNQRFCELMKTPMPQVLGRKITVFAIAAQKPAIEAVLADAQKGPLQRHLSLRTADGADVPVLISANPLQTGDGSAICLVASDLTELEASANSIRVLREQRQALAESEERLRQAAQAAHFGVYCADLAKNELYWSPEMRQIVGLSDDIPTPQTPGTIPDFIHPDDVERVRQLMRTAYDPAGNGLVRSEHRIVRPDGTIRWVLLKGQVRFEGQGPDRRPGHSYGIMLDITERKEAEQALRKSEERLRLALDAAYLLSFEWDIQRDQVQRYSPHEPTFAFTQKGSPHTFADMREAVHPADRDRFVAGVRAAMHRDDGQYENEFRFVAADGKTRWLYERGLVQRDDQGRPVRLIGLSQDITDRKLAEHALRRSEAKYRTLFESIDEGFCVIEVLFDDQDRPIDYRLLEVNPAFARHTGLDNALGRRMRELAPNHENFWFEVYGRVARTRQPARFQSPSAALNRFFDVYAFPIGEPHQARVAVLFNDVTEHKRAEEALRHSNVTLEAKVAERTAELEHRAQQLQKLALELSAAEDRERRRLAEILHDDLQQQLAGTKFHLNILAKRLKGNGETHEMVKQIDAMIKEAIHSSRSLSHELSPAVLYRSDLCETFEWLADDMKSKHGLVIHVAGNNVTLESDALKAFVFKAGQELLFNIVKHARVEEAWVRIRRLGPCVALRVRDRGRGFDPQQLEDAKGFGLLSIRERVELLGGRMKIRSAPETGSCFVISVPDRDLAEQAEQLEHAARQVLLEQEDESDSEQPPCETVLRVVVADDHEIVRQGLAALFEDEPDIELVGEAGNGREAVDVAAQTRPDVVIMDVSMPLMSGEEATRQIKAYVPGTRVIALSMFGDPIMAEKMRRVGAEAYLCKTDASDKLLATIRACRAPQHKPRS